MQAQREHPRWPSLHPVDEADEELLLSALRQQNWTRDEQTLRFEQSFAAFCGAQHALLVDNGTAALKLALLSLGIGPRDEVILPGLTWPSVAIAIMECGAMPVVADVDPRTYCLSADTIGVKLTARTRAVIPTHLFCSQADMPPILDLAKSRGIHVVEDAAHSVGARRHGRFSGTYGAFGCFSFNRKKLLTCGEGGCLITDDADLDRRARLMREVDPAPTVAPRRLPGTHLLSEFQAAVLRSQLDKLPPLLTRMERNAEFLRDLIERYDGARVLDRLPGTELQTFYAFCFNVDGVANIASLRRNLEAEMGLSVSAAYLPLNETMVLDPRNDPPYRHLAQGLAVPLPNCHRAHHRQAVRFRHNVLLAEKADLEYLAASIGALIARERTIHPI